MARKKLSSSKSKLSANEVEQFIDDNQPGMNGDDSMNDQSLPDGEAEQRPVSTTKDNSRVKKKKEKSSRKKKRKPKGDPSGYSTTKNEETSLYTSEELNPLTPSSGSSSAGNKNLNMDDDEVEEYELLDDTFTFLMTGNYPFEQCLCAKQMKSQLGNPEQEEEDPQKNQDHLKNEYEMDERTGDFVLSKKSSNQNHKSTMTIKARNPDKYNLPFWVGSFVIFSQIFIYTIVIANVFNQELPPNADTWLRLAQVSC